MRKRFFNLFKAILLRFSLEFSSFSKELFRYLQKKVMNVSLLFEDIKNFLVKFFTMKRGRYSRPFLHLATIGVIGVGVIVGPFLANTYPVFSSNIATPSASNEGQSIIVGENVFQTQVSQKPRDKIIIYTVEKGDTISTIAQKFGIADDTIRWENDLTSDNITVGDTLKILPVTGVSYKVKSGDTVYTIAKKLDTDPQKIVDFPFNDFANPETFSLVEGQILIVPDGIKPSEAPIIRRQVYVVSGPVSISSAGFTWPVRGIITQFAAWYHMALDIAAPFGTPIVAAQDGVVSKVSVGTYDSGYGNNVYVDNGAGYASHYAHMSAVNVSAGTAVTAGKTVIGWVGLTGRTTGPHVHFEILRNGVLVNPLGFLQ